MHGVAEFQALGYKMYRIINVVILVGIVAILSYLFYPAFDAPHEAITNISAETEAIKSALQQYKEKFAAYPKGTTAEICKELTGGNKEKIVFLDFPKKIIDSNGSFLDPWGTPYEIFISESGILIRSAGKDHVFTEGYVKGSDDFYAW